MEIIRGCTSTHKLEGDELDYNYPSEIIRCCQVAGHQGDCMGVVDWTSLIVKTIRWTRDEAGDTLDGATAEEDGE